MSLQKAMSNIVYIKNNRDCATSAQWQIMVILISAPHNFDSLPLPSAQGRQGHTHRIALRFPLSSTRGEGKEECVGDMNQNIFNDTDFSRFTSHLKLLFIPHQAHEHYNEHRHILSSHHLHLLGIFF